MDWRNYLGSIWLAFVVLLVFNVLYIALGFSTILLFNQGVYALFSVVGVIGFFVPIVTYGYVTWKVKNKQKGDALDSAAAAVVLSLLVFVASEVVGIVATSSTFSSIVPSSLVSTALRANFAEQYLNVSNVVLGLVFGLVLGGCWRIFWVHRIRDTIKVYPYDEIYSTK